ncbi:hypothetical protein [Anaeromyxobacter diazotrophicus]|uniref:Uncharacterized protein n=1 Tax=Anaeromyxobacter diazotrophicus TaxID=2590199 RepID=A0A7I9VQK9_9BACT|nr:hypothetical protein [Anaeromyxobacter diazotrophicus]GEJ58694.1 hypothetical protein AMYX_34350 [Anaeromyxobacter diazotrophicus]
MQGAITTRDVLLHGPTIVRCSGPRTYLRCLRALFARRPTTFLAVVCSGRR